MDLATAPVPESGPCLYKGVMVACGPPGLNAARIFFFTTMVMVPSPMFLNPPNSLRQRHLRLGVLTADFDNDGWPDIYVANDSTASASTKIAKMENSPTSHGSRCALSADGNRKPVWASPPRTTTSTAISTSLKPILPETLLRCITTSVPQTSKTPHSPPVSQAHSYLGWGCGFLDFDNDGWPDILICNGHVYPEVQQLTTEAGYAQRSCSIAISAMAVRRCLAQRRIGHLNAFSVSRRRFRRLRQRWRHRRRRQLCQRLPATPSLRLHFKKQLDQDPNDWNQIKSQRYWRSLALHHPRCERNQAAPANRRSPQWRRLLSQNDLRVHFGLGSAEKVDLLEIRWPSGQLDALKDLKPNRLYYVTEGQGITRTETFQPATFLIPPPQILQHPHVRSARGLPDC